MPVIASILAAAIPMFAYLSFLWKLDKYDKEPVWNVIKHFIWGAAGSVILALIGGVIVSAVLQNIFLLDSVSISIWETIIIAPIVEELVKGIYLIKTVNSKEFDNLTDGLVYGGAIGLGFGMTENFLYFFAYGVDFQSWIGLVIIRTIFSAVMHCISTASFGAFLAMAKFNLTPMKVFIPISGYAVAVFIHFMWNLSVSFAATYILGLVFMLLAIIFFIVLFYLSLANERKIISNELKEEAEISLIPSEHIAILSSNHKNKKGWIEENLRKRYVRNAVRLAFRKHQVKHASGKLLQYYHDDIKSVKEKLTEIVNSIRKDYKVE